MTPSYLCQSTLILFQRLLDTQQHSRFPIVQLGDLIVPKHSGGESFHVRLLARQHELVRKFSFARRGESDVFSREIVQEALGRDEVLLQSAAITLRAEAANLRPYPCCTTQHGASIPSPSILSMPKSDSTRLRCSIVPSTVDTPPDHLITLPPADSTGSRS
jgi:hypothetical protein